MAAMTDTEAAQVRELAWTQGMRKTFSDTPGFYRACACQAGRTWHCAHGSHSSCHRAMPLRSIEAYIVGRGGGVAHLPEEYQHPTDTSAIGPRTTAAAQVWLADRVCRWVCPCECHGPETTTPAPADRRRFGGPWEQPALFDHAHP